MSIQHKIAILIYIRFSLAQPYALLMLYSMLYSIIVNYFLQIRV